MNNIRENGASLSVVGGTGECAVSAEQRIRTLQRGYMSGNKNEDGAPRPPTAQLSDESDNRAASEDEGQLSDEARDLIGRKLREAYSSKMNEPIPERFGRLLEALAKKD